MAKTTNKNFWPAVILIVLGLALALGGIGAAKNIANVLITIIGVILIAYGILSIFKNYSFIVKNGNNLSIFFLSISYKLSTILSSSAETFLWSDLSFIQVIIPINVPRSISSAIFLVLLSIRVDIFMLVQSLAFSNQLFSFMSSILCFFCKLLALF